MSSERRINIAQWIHAGPCVVRVEVEAVIFPDCPDPSLEPQAVRWLEELQRVADTGNVDEPSRHGTVYVRRSACSGEPVLPWPPLRSLYTTARRCASTHGGTPPAHSSSARFAAASCASLTIKDVRPCEPNPARYAMHCDSVAGSRRTASARTTGSTSYA
jgi:hypothetical protein